MNKKGKKKDKWENVYDYNLYLEYRMDYKRKLGYEEFRKNHRYRFVIWKKRRHIEYMDRMVVLLQGLDE